MISTSIGSIRTNGKPVDSGSVAEMFESLQIDVVSKIQDPEVESIDLLPEAVGIMTSTRTFLPTLKRTVLNSPKSNAAPYTLRICLPVVSGVFLKPPNGFCPSSRAV